MPEIKSERDVITTVGNKDAKFLHGKFVALKDEIELSVTANGHETKPADVVRFKSFVADLRGALEHVQMKPEIDAPKYAPNVYTIMEFGEKRDIENDICEAIIDELEILDYQMIASSSAQRRLVAFNPFDYKRLVDGFDRLDLKIKHLEDFRPLDLQESTPTSPVAGHGKQL